LNTILKGESRNRQRIFIFSNDHHLEWRMGHNIEMGSPMDHPNQDWLNLVQWFQRKRFKCESLWCRMEAK
jgi:hypothetical protein